MPNTQASLWRRTPSPWRYHHDGMHLAKTTEFHASSEREARRLLREHLSITRLPAGTVVWKVSKR